MDEQLPDRELWALLRNKKSAQARSELLAKYKPLVQQLAFKLMQQLGMPSDLDNDELVSLGTIGLIQSVDRFDPDLGVPFDAYARIRIKGAMLDGLKHHSELRAQLHYEYQKNQQRIRSLDEGGRESGFEQLAGVAIGLAIGFMLEDTAMYQQDPEQSCSYGGQSELAVLREQLSSEIARLPKQQKQVMVMHYFQGLQFAEIARLLGLTRARISQVHKQAIQNIRLSFHEKRKIDISV